MEITFRNAEAEDCALILSFIKALAEYENMTDEVTATEELLREWLFNKKAAEVFFACDGKKEIGFALFFHNFTAVLGRGGIYLEDLYVLPEYRGRGCGKKMLRELARIAEERGCGRLEWACLDWNRPSIGFYLSMGAEAKDRCITYKLAGEKLDELARAGH